MPPEVPEPIRAVAGLAVTALDQARQLPAKLTALPVRAAGLAMQLSLKAQQEYAGLVVRGDEVVSALRGGSTDDDPPWATFDDDDVAVAEQASTATGVGTTADQEAPPATPPPLPGTTRPRRRTRSTGPGTSASAAGRLGHAPSAFDLAEDSELADRAATDTGARAVGDPLAEALVTSGPVGAPTAADLPDSRDAGSDQAPVPGYDALTLAQLRARLRTFDQDTLTRLLAYEHGARARAPFLTMLENRLARTQA